VHPRASQQPPVPGHNTRTWPHHSARCPCPLGVTRSSTTRTRIYRLHSTHAPVACVSLARRQPRCCARGLTPKAAHTALIIFISRTMLSSFFVSFPTSSTYPPYQRGASRLAPRCGRSRFASTEVIVWFCVQRSDTGPLRATFISSLRRARSASTRPRLQCCSLRGCSCSSAFCCQMPVAVEMLVQKTTGIE